MESLLPERRVNSLLTSVTFFRLEVISLRKIVAILPAWLKQLFAEDIGGSIGKRRMTGAEHNRKLATVWSV